MQNRLTQQLSFLHEIDKLKLVFRKTHLISDKNRHENTAEHSWHLAMYVMLLAEHANEPINILHAVKMALIHDIVEIDADDTFCYDTTSNESKTGREQKAADRIFALLPKDQGEPLRALWDEFEAGETKEAKFVVAVDRVHPMLHNYLNNGGSWKAHGIKRNQVEARMEAIPLGSTTLYEYMREIISDAAAKQFLEV